MAATGRRTMIRLLLALLLLATAHGHEMRPAYLEITELEGDRAEVLWKVPARGAMRLRLDVLFPPEVEVVVPPVETFADNFHVSRWQIERPGGLSGTEVEIEGLTSAFTDAMVRVKLHDIDPQVLLLKPESPGFTITERPGRGQIAATYFRIGIEHILLGVDHLLFVLGLLLLVDRRWMLVKTITAFTVAHSITLALSTFATLRVPENALNAAIALSILFLGPEVVRKWRGGDSLTLRHPWVVAFGFGLLHGIGFASGLSLTGVPRPEIPNALLFFNLGVEAGQLAFVALALITAAALRSLRLDRSVWVARLPGYAVGGLGAFWTIDRVAAML